MKKEFNIFTRPGHGDELYCRFRIKGKQYWRNLETTDRKAGQLRAKLKYEEILKAESTKDYQRLDGTKLRASESTTLEKLYETYLAGPSEASMKTREQNINALKQLAGEETHIRGLTPALVRRWFETVNQRVLATDDQNAAASLKRSGNSRWIQAKSLFTDNCLAYYQEKGLIESPHALMDFVRAGKLARFKRLPKQNYNPPDDKIVQATLDAWAKLEDRDMFLAIGHELAFGLRLSEVAQVDWSWHTTRNDYPMLDGTGKVKNGTGLVQVRALDPYYSIMMRRVEFEKWLPAEGGPIITGTKTYTTDNLFRAVSEWLRGLGWKTQKTNHALRAYAGGQVAMKYGPYAAQIFLRHASIQVTESSYSYFVNKFKPDNLNELPARWAKVKTSAIPEVALDATVEAWTAPKRN